MPIGICVVCNEERDIYVKGKCIRCNSLMARRKLTVEEVRAYLAHPDYNPRRGGRKNGFILKAIKGPAKKHDPNTPKRKKLPYVEQLPLAELIRMYAEDKMTLVEVSAKGGMPISTLRRKLQLHGVLRSNTEAQSIAASLGRKSHAKGKTRTVSQDTKNKIREARNKWADKHASGVCLKQSGYKEHTRGQHKFRSVHRVIMEEHLGRELAFNEVVHHIDENRQNNDLANLALMTREEHSRHHALQRIQRRTHAEQL